VDIQAGRYPLFTLFGPESGLKVNDLEQSIGFCTKMIGCNLVWEEERVA
jgi:hypothetical protein